MAKEGKVAGGRGDSRETVVQPDDPRLDRLAELIATSPHNLVSRGERAQVRTVHIPECLAIAAALPAADDQRWADLGTGAGLPGLVCAMAHLNVNWTLIDATRKKVAFVAETATELSLANVDAVHGRLEDLGGPSGGLVEAFDGVVSRALAPLSQLLPLARPLVPADGVIVAVKGSAWRDDAAKAAPLLRRLRLSEPSVRELKGLARPTVLLEFRATGPLPHGAGRARGGDRPGRRSAR